MFLKGDGDPLKSLLLCLLKEQGFSRVCILSPLPVITVNELPPGGHCDQAYPPGSRSAILCFLPYYSKGVRSVDPLKALLAPFAQANYYKESVNRLKKVWSALRHDQKSPAYGLSKGEGTIFCNSRYPEKQMAWHCGLGVLGKNSLMITPEYGSLGVISGLFLPFELEGDKPVEKEPYETCGSCRLCSDACPGNALRGEGGIVKSLCYQHLSTSHEILSEPVMETWGNILYGCQICQNVCPCNRNKPDGIPSDLGVLGAGLDPVTLLSLSDQEMKTFLKGSVPGASWIKPAVLRRNALLCLPRDERFRGLALKYAHSEDPVLAGTAEYVINTIPDKV